MHYPRWLKGGTGIAIYAILGLFVLYGAYALFVTWSSGTDVTMEVRVGTNPDGTMFLHCGAASSPGVCDPNDPHPEQATFHVPARAHVHVLVVNQDGGDHTHDIRLLGGAYWLWPAGFENELDNCAGGSAPCADTGFTAYATGEYRIICEIAGHDDRGMHGTLSVE